MFILVEGLAMCFILLIICIIGTANGADGGVFWLSWKNRILRWKDGVLYFDFKL